MKNVLILGAAGFVGSHLAVQCLKQEGVTLTAIDALHPSMHASLHRLQPILDQVHFIKGDILDDSFLVRMVQNQDIIFNCAAQTSHILSVQNPIWDAENNVIASLKLLEAVRIYNPSAVVVYPSTTTVIGKAEEPIIDESHSELPLEIYSANKAAAEKYYAIYHHYYGLKTIILRLGNLYGPFGKSRPEYGVFNYFIDQAWHDQPLTIYGAGDQVRNVTYIEDAVDLLWEMVSCPDIYGEICFATSPYHASIREVAEKIIQVFGRGEIVTLPWPPHRKRIEIGPVHFSAEKLRALTGFRMTHDLEAGLRKTRAILEEASYPLAN